MISASRAWALAVIGGGCLWLALLAPFIVLGYRVALVASIVPLVLAPVVWAKSTGRPIDPLDPLWWISGLFVFVYAAVPALEAYDPVPFESLSGLLGLSPFHFKISALLAGGAYLVWLTAYVWAAPVRAAIWARGRVMRSDGNFATFLGPALLMVGAVSLVSTLLVANIVAFSPLEIATGELRVAVLDALPGRGYLTLGLLCFPLGIAVMTGAFAARLQQVRLGRWVPVAAGVLLAAVFMVLLGSRELAVLSVLLPFAVTHFMVRPWSAWGTLLTVVVLVAGAITAVSLRNSGALPTGVVAGLGFAGKTFDGFNFLVNSLARVHSFAWGRTVIEDVGLTYVPRMFFPDKPTTFGIVAAQDAVVPGLSVTTGGSGTYPPGILAEGYVNWGVIGVVAIPAAIGVAARFLYEGARGGESLYFVLLVGMMLGSLTALFRGFGPWLASMLLIAILLAPLVLVPSVRFRLTAGRGLVAAALLAALVVGGLSAGPLRAGERRSATPRADQGIPVGSTLDRRTLAAIGVSHGEIDRPRLVLVAAPWCAECTPLVTEIQKRLRAGRVPPVIHVSPYADGEAYRAASAPHWTAVADPDGTITTALRVYEVPFGALVGRGGRVLCTFQNTADFMRAGGEEGSCAAAASSISKKP